MKKLSKKKEEIKAATIKKQTASETLVEKEKTFDLGGLPDRNLKKNLGC